MEQVGRTHNVVLSHFLHKMYGKQLKLADFSIFGQIYQFPWLETVQNDHDTLNRHHLSTFQWFSKFHQIHWRVTVIISGAQFAKNYHFSQLNDFNESKSIINQHHSSLALLIKCDNRPCRGDCHFWITPHQNFSGLKILLDQKFFWPTFFSSKSFFGQKFLAMKIFCVWNFSLFKYSGMCDNHFYSASSIDIQLGLRPRRITLFSAE